MKKILNNKGASVVEYCCLCALIAAALIPSIYGIGDGAYRTFRLASNAMEDFGVGTTGSNCGEDGICTGSEGGRFGGNRGGHGMSSNGNGRGSGQGSGSGGSGQGGGSSGFGG